jgi:type IV pilus assembly protein PilB
VADSQQKYRFGEILLREGLLTSSQLEKAVLEQGRRNSDLPLGEVCVSLKFLTKADLQKALRKHKKHIYLGDLFVNMGIVSPDEVLQALELQQIEGKRIGQLLIDNGFITESNLMNALSSQLGIPIMIPNAGIVSPTVLKGLNKSFLVKNDCIPAYRDGDSVTVIMADPLSDDTINSLEKMFRCRIDVAVAPSSDIQKCIRMIYDELKLVTDGSDAPQKSSFKKLVIDGKSSVDGKKSTIVEVLNFILTEALNDGATDIHIEPMDNLLRIRYRIDGTMHHKTDLPIHLLSELTGRFKALSGLDISEKRKHQDGRLPVRVMNKNVDLRISTYPAVTGESIVIRVLRNQASMMELGMLGISPMQLDLMKRILAVPAGITITAGPSGCGKTTSLYASLLHLLNTEKKILTVEDPIEYTIDGVIQGQISEKSGLTYDNFVKSMLRQDPDVIMVGEMRDKESAEAVLETALTGHKVLTSFHTDESTGALMRMYGIGAETFLISSTLMSIIAQRLVRILCPHCRQPYTPSPEILSAFGSIDPLNHENYRFLTSSGCVECNNTGYHGLTAISEVLIVNNDIRDGILKRLPTGQIREIARNTANLLSLQEDGFYKATKGITSLEEILRQVVCHESDARYPLSSEQVVTLIGGEDAAYTTTSRSSSSIYSP